MPLRRVPAAFALAAAILFGMTEMGGAAPWASASVTGLAHAGSRDAVTLVKGWHHRRPHHYMRYNLPPDIFKPRCWVNKWGVFHCPYQRRLRHWQKRHCRVDYVGRLHCPR